MSETILDKEQEQETMELFEEEFGKQPQLKEVPTEALVDFKNYYKLFENTHKHLEAYNFIDTELNLTGEEFYPVKKLLSYGIESIRQPTIPFTIGTEDLDNRINILVIGGAGTGKGMTKKLYKHYKDCFELSAARTNTEQLVGKIKENYGKQREEPGHFRKKVLILDESQAVLREEKPILSDIMREVRIAMDIYGHNKVEKKLVDTNQLSFYPETRFMILTHELIFPPVFFDTGTYRRLLATHLKTVEVEEWAAVQSIYNISRESEFKEYINTDTFEITKIKFENEAINEITDFVINWNRFTCTNENQRLRALGKKYFFHIKNYFFKFAAVFSISKGNSTITKESAVKSSLDCVHMLLKTFELYCNNSTLSLSRDTWKTGDMKEAQLFEWMEYNKATSKETTPLSITDVQEQIGNIFGSNERPSRSIYAKLKKEGLIDDKQGYQESWCWLAFQPVHDKNIKFDFTKIKEVDFTAYLIDKIKSHGGYGGSSSTPPLLYENNTYTHESIRINNNNTINQGVGKNLSTMTTIEKNPVSRQNIVRTEKSTKTTMDTQVQFWEDKQCKNIVPSCNSVSVLDWVKTNPNKNIEEMYAELGVGCIKFKNELLKENKIVKTDKGFKVVV